MKGAWESRVGLLLRNPAHFVWAYKPADSALYGGQPRIDWLACNRLGGFWMVEVKQLASNRKSINLLNDVSPGQRDALTAIATTTFGVSLLAVGQAETLYMFDWRKIVWRLKQDVGFRAHQLVSLRSAPIQVQWTGATSWANDQQVYQALQNLRSQRASRNIPPTLIVPERLRKFTGSSASTSKPEDSIPTPAWTVPLEPSSSE